MDSKMTFAGLLMLWTSGRGATASGRSAGNILGCSALPSHCGLAEPERSAWCGLLAGCGVILGRVTSFFVSLAACCSGGSLARPPDIKTAR